jgi:TonB family protein
MLLLISGPLGAQGKEQGAERASQVPAEAGSGISDTATCDPDHPAPGSDLELLSKNYGVDFVEYLRGIREKVRKNWYLLVPQQARWRKTCAVIEFAIRRDGAVAAMKLVKLSGDVALDDAAWGGITVSSPFFALPDAYPRESIRLRFHFYYNPGWWGSAKRDAKLPHPSTPPVLMSRTIESGALKYPSTARKAKVEGIVRLEAEVGTDGKVKDLKVLEGDPMLAEASIHAIRKWRFYPAQKDGKPVEDRARIRVDFRLDRKHALAELTPPDLSPSPAR